MLADQSLWTTCLGNEREATADPSISERPMSRRFASFFVLLTACTPGPGDFDYGSPAPNSQPFAEEEAPIPLGLPDSFVEEVTEEDAGSPQDVATDTGPSDAGNNCPDEVFFGGQWRCI
jgi:hypothetical protein